jgi:hypothetical protein
MTTHWSGLLRAGSAGLAALLLGSLTNGLPAGAAGVVPVAPSVAFDSLLRAEDVPSYGVAITAQEVSADDLPAFEANDGIREVSRRWTNTAGLLFDFRFQFPDARSAEGFLDAAEEALAELQSGAARRDPPFTPLIDTRYYVLDDFLVGYNYLMRYENLVAKVYVGGGQHEVEEATAAAIAQAAAARMMASLEARTDPPTVDELLPHIPDSLQGCAPSSSTEGTPLGYGEVARVDCDPNDQASIEFQLFRTVQDMDGAFDELRRDAREKDTTSTPDGCAAGWFDGTWTLGDQEAGRLVCTTPVDGPALLIWTHPESRILGSLVQDDGDAAAAYDLWTVAGPLPAEPGISPKPSAEPSVEPSGSGGPFPTELEAELLSHIPPALRDGCGRTDFRSPTSNAAIGCSTPLGDGSLTITYQSYGDADAMDTAYSNNLSFMQVERDTGPCSGEWPGEGTYTIGGEAAGRVACSEFGDAARFMSWTDDRLLIHVYAEGFEVDRDAFYQWWLNDSGPVS